jgi:hypothetical protein
VTEATLGIGLGTGTAAGAVARMPTRTRLPGGMSPSWHVRTRAPVQVPSVDTAEITVTPRGSTSVSVTSGAADGPRLPMERKYDSCVPVYTGSGDSRLVTKRSAVPAGYTVVASELVLLVRFGSSTPFEAIVAVLTATAGVASAGSMVKVVMIVREAPGSSVSNSHGNAVTQSPVLATKRNPAGSGSAISTLSAGAGPRFSTSIE